MICAPDGVEEEHVGLADRDADQVGAPRGAHHRVGDLGIGHQHVLGVARQVDHHGLADADRHELGRAVADHVRHGRRPAAIGRIGRAMTGAGGRQPDMAISAASGGAQQLRSHHVSTPCISLARYFGAMVVTPKRTVLIPVRPAALVGRRRVVVGVEQAAQRERQRSGLARQRERLGLARAQLERRGLADHHALAVLLLDRLVDREHAHVGQDGLAGGVLGAAWRRLFSRRDRITSTRSFGRMKPPAPVSGEISVEMARMPDGRIAAM